MKTQREHRDDRKTPRTATAPRAAAPWQRPDFVELSACAEIGAYAFHTK